jgi:hypothetical protein
MRSTAIAGVLLALACGKASPREPSAGPVEVAGAGAASAPATVPRAAAASASVDCATLTRRACLEAPSCTLVHEPKPPRRDLYRCRPAEPPCETIIAQSAFSGEDREGARRQCQSQSGCVLDPGGCYCPCRGSGQTSVPDGPEASDCNCACGGGPPPRCKLAAK